MKSFYKRDAVPLAGIVGCLVVSLCSCSRAKPLEVFHRQSNEEVGCLAFSPDGAVLAIGSSAPSTKGLPEGTIELWDVKAGKLSTTLRQSALQEHSDTANRVSSVSFSPDGKWVVGSDMIGYSLWDLSAGTQKYQWHSGIGDPESSVGWSSDSRKLALPSMERAHLGMDTNGFSDLVSGIAVIDVPTGNRTAFFPVDVGFARAARISPDGKLLATAGHDCTVRVFDLVAQTNIFTDFAQATMYAACFSPDGRYLVAGSGWGGSLLIYQITSEGGKVKINKKRPSLAVGLELHQIEFTHDGRRAFANYSGAAALWDSASWTTPRQLPGCRGGLSPDGNRVALVRDQPDVIELWDLEELAKTMR